MPAPRNGLIGRISAIKNAVPTVLVVVGLWCVSCHVLASPLIAYLMLNQK